MSLASWRRVCKAVCTVRAVPLVSLYTPAGQSCVRNCAKSGSAHLQPIPTSQSGLEGLAANRRRLTSHWVDPCAGAVGLGSGPLRHRKAKWPACRIHNG